MGMLRRILAAFGVFLIALILGWVFYPLFFEEEEQEVVRVKAVLPERKEPAPVEKQKELPVPVVIEETPEKEETPEPVVEPEPVIVVDTSGKVARRTKSGRSQIEKHYAKLIQKKAKDGAFVANDLTEADWAKPEMVMEKLSTQMMAKMGDFSDKALFEFLSDPKNRLDLARWDLIRAIQPEGIKQAVLEEPAVSATLAAMGGDLNWLENFMYSGPMVNGSNALKILAKLGTQDPEALKDETLRRIASTVALEFARQRWKVERAMPRYAYFAQSWRDKKLNKSFDDLHYWDTRIITGCAADNPFGDERSLAWQRDNVRLPARLYTGAAYQVPYRLKGIAGDAVFNEDYYRPYRPYLNDIQALVTREVGAVCGGLSHFGAYAAVANGVPAMPMGEPGHCSYTVRVDGVWKKCNSIYWAKSPFWRFWERTWDFLLLTQDLYGDFDRTRVSDEATALARLLTSAGKFKQALNTYEMAVVLQPLNYPAWQEFCAALTARAPEDLDWWRDAHDIMLAGMASRHGEVCATLLRQCFYPALSPLMKDRKALMALYAEFLGSLETMGDNRWDVGKVLTAMFQTVQSSSADQVYFLKSVAKILMEKPAFSGPVLAWGLEATSSQPEDVQETFLRLVTNAMKKGKKGDSDMWTTCGEAMYTASANNDKATFQAIGNIVYKKYKNKFPKGKIPKFRKFSGTLVSAKGLIKTMATIDPSGAVCLQWGVLQPCGGSIDAKFAGKFGGGMTVELEYPSKLSGAVVVFPSKDVVVKPGMYGAGGVSAGAKPFKLQISDDGSNWADACTIEKPDDAVLRFDMGRERPRARYVRLVRDGDMITTSLVGFYVYGRPAN